MDPSASRAHNTSAPRSPWETHPIETKSTFTLHVSSGKHTSPQARKSQWYAGRYWARGRPQVLTEAQKPPAPQGVGCTPINRTWGTGSLRSHASVCLLSPLTPLRSQACQPPLPCSPSLRLPGLTCFYSPLVLYNAALSSCHFSFLGIV